MINTKNRGYKIIDTNKALKKMLGGKSRKTLKQGPIYYYRCSKCKGFTSNKINALNTICPHCGYIDMRRVDTNTAIIHGYLKN